jgi:hypothetical protein
MGIDVRINVFPEGTEEVEGEKSKTWYDPVLITRFTADIRDKWLFQFRGDIGGFGIGSVLSWQLHAIAGYRFTKIFQMSLENRILSTDSKQVKNRKSFFSMFMNLDRKSDLGLISDNFRSICTGKWCSGDPFG